MARWLLARLGRAALTVVAAALALFLLVRLAPGDPAQLVCGEGASPEEIAETRARLGLDRPWSAQLGDWAASVLDGSLGRSFRRPDRTVASLLAEALGPTSALALAALAVGWGLGLPLGLLAAVRRGTVVDRAATSLATLGLALPNIVLGPLLVLLFGVVLRLAPLPGDAPDTFAALVLPAVTVGTALAALVARHGRAAVGATLLEPFVQAARARGASPLRTLLRHGLRPSLLPLVTVAASQLGALLSGTVVAERIFERPGLGTLVVSAFRDRDLPLLQGCALLVAGIYVLVHLVLDVLYGVLDPRVRRA